MADFTVLSDFGVAIQISVLIPLTSNTLKVCARTCAPDCTNSADEFIEAQRSEDSCPGSHCPL